MRVTKQAAQKLLGQVLDPRAIISQSIHANGQKSKGLLKGGCRNNDKQHLTIDKFG
jgi:hypothetical protein